ncbi:CoA ester lyase [Campylobacter sp. RM9333]|uniref:HpcH/HpaI aldolase/citrate lyase family protein n=1 Tax=unclassified Campylobacter TaxID=2593542 RepID=UPI001BD97160|nr:CoA ester lyase [Campylobacter sp. 2018MI01]MBT0878801.1 citrate lyase subunit beta [Campylobacter sp. 2018MI01]MBZ7992575.1 CoA ester lyase [Campylobacter sp. RM9333]
MRRTLLFIPGNNAGNIQNAGLFGADAIIFDLEDAVSPMQKDSALNLVCNALTMLNYECEKIVRINLENAKNDILALSKTKINSILIPKAENVEEIKELIKYTKNLNPKIEILLLIETPLGLLNAKELAFLNGVSAICFGAEDYTSEIGARRSESGVEIDFARNYLLNVCKAAKIDAIDTPYTNINDENGLIADTTYIKNLGFDGKLVISPRHIDIIHNCFKPSEKEIIWANQVLNAIKEAELKKSGVISLNGKMIDAPIVSRAKKILKEIL